MRERHHRQPLRVQERLHLAGVILIGAKFPITRTAHAHPDHEFRGEPEHTASACLAVGVPAARRRAGAGGGAAQWHCHCH